MSIAVECECGKTLKVPEKLAGKTIRCKECGETIKVAGGKQKTYDNVGDEEDEYGDEPAPLRGKVKEAKLPGTAKKKKKKSKKSSGGESQGLPKWLIPVAIVLGLGVGGFGAYLGVKAIAGAASAAKVEAATLPENFVEVVNTDGGFKFEAPEGWEAETGGGTGGRPPWGKFSKGDVSFDMRADLKGAPIADIQSIGDDGTAPPEESPVARVHAFQTEMKYAVEYKDFKEQPGGFHDVPFGQGWLTEFTASEGTFGGKIHGYRLTLLGGTHQFNVICKCSEKNWETWKPFFEKVMKTISR